MNRRIALSITFIAFNLMACCCGGVGPAKGLRQAAVTQAATHVVKVDFSDPDSVFENIKNISPDARKQFKGTEVTVSGFVYRSKPDDSDGPNIMIVMKQDSVFAFGYFKSNAKKFVSSVVKNSNISLTGVIDRVSWDGKCATIDMDVKHCDYGGVKFSSGR